MIDVGAGNVEFVGGEAFGIFKDSNDFHILGGGFTENIGHNWHLKLAQKWEFVGDEGPYADVLKANGVNHATCGLAHPGGGVADPRLNRQSFDDYPAQGIKVNQMGEFDPIAESAAGGNDRILEGEGADLNSEVDSPLPA